MKIASGRSYFYLWFSCHWSMAWPVQSTQTSKNDNVAPGQRFFNVTNSVATNSNTYSFIVILHQLGQSHK